MVASPPSTIGLLKWPIKYANVVFYVTENRDVIYIRMSDYVKL